MAKFSHFCALDVATTDRYFHSGGCACSAEETNKNMEHFSAGTKMRRPWLQVCTMMPNVWGFLNFII